MSEAKVRLLSDIDAMRLTRKPPHIPQRRNGAGRLELEAGDLFTLFTFVDDMKAIDQLPTYVSSSPNNMPNLRLYEGDMHVLLSLLKSMDKRVSAFESMMAAITRDVRALQVWPPLPGQSLPSTAVHTRDVNSTVSIENDCRSVAGQYGQGQGSTQPTAGCVGNFAAGVSLPPASDHPAPDWAAVDVSSPYVSENRFARLGSVTDDDDPQQPFSLVQSRNSRRRRRRSSELQQPHQLPAQSQARSSPNTGAQQQRRGPLLLGKAKNGSYISASRKQRRKTVICVDNVSTGCSVEHMTRFIASLSVKVLTCFEVKPRRRHDESEDDVRDKRAFRVCIYADELERLLEAEAWPEYVTVSTWFSKSKANVNLNANADLNANVDNKRMRLGSDHSTGRSTRQLVNPNSNDDREPPLQLAEDRVNSADPAIVPAVHMQSPVGADDDDVIITDRVEMVEVRDEDTVCAVVVPGNDGE